MRFVPLLFLLASVARAEAPLALVYRGPGAACEDCPEAAARLLQSSRFGFRVEFVGPNEATALDDAALARATLYVQPGGEGTSEEAYEHLQRHRERIRNFVQGGGRYLGICMGGYLAGDYSGFGILPGEAFQYTASPDAVVTTTDDTLAPVRWNGRARQMFFQDGPAFRVEGKVEGVTILARYGGNDGAIASLAAPFGKGRVGVVGPHPEATQGWYRVNGLSDPDGIDADLGRELVEVLMAP